MSSLRRLRRIISANPSVKAADKTLKPASSHSDDYETPQGLRNVVDNFKKSSESKKFRRWNAIYESTVLRLAKVQAFSMIEEILDAQKKYKEMSSEGFVIRLMSLYGKAGMFDHAQALFDEMPHFKCQRTVKSFSALLDACVNAKRLDKVEEIFWELPSKYSIEPDVVSYNVVIHAFCQMGSMDLALSMLDEMEKLGMEPNLITFNTLLGAFYEKRQFEEGEKIWALMQSRSVAPDVVSYNSRLRGMILDDRIPAAVKLIDEMRMKGVKPDVHSFNALIKGFCSDGKLEEAKYWYGELVKHECTPDRTTYVTLVPFLCEEGDFDVAFQLCKAATGSRLLIDVAVLKQAVEALLTKGMTEEARELVVLARKKKLEIDFPLNNS